MTRTMKATFTYLIVTLLILTLLMVTIPFTTAASGYVMYAPPLTVPVTVDGNWTSGEWDDAPQYIMTGPSGETSYIRAKFNSSHLYVIIDSPWDTTNATLYPFENVWLAFDTLNDGGSAPQTDDYLVHGVTSWTTGGYTGNGTAWDASILSGVLCVQAGMIPPPVAPLRTSPNDLVNPHRITEIAIPMGYVGSPGSTVGFYAQVDDDSTDPDGTNPAQTATAYAEWSPGAGGSPGWPGPPVYRDPCPAPSAWGSLKLASVMYAPPLTVPVTVDGNWTSGEWDDAPQYIMTGPSGETSYIRAKFTSSRLYVIIDSPWDTINTTIYNKENVWLAFDTLNDGGSAPQTDDYLVHSSTEWFPTVSWVGDGTLWNQSIIINGVLCVQAGMKPPPVAPLRTSPNDLVNPHVITEMAIPMAYVGSPGSTVGFYAQVDDDSTDPDGTGQLPATAYAEWSPGAGGSPGWPGPPVYRDPCPAPSAWGDLKLSVPGTPIWDIDGNALIDIGDIVIVAIAFGTTPGTQNWNPNADVIKDNIVDIGDIVYVAIHFGEAY